MYTHAEATTIINNCDHLLYLGSQDQQTAESILCILHDKAMLITNSEKSIMVDKDKTLQHRFKSGMM